MEPKCASVASRGATNIPYKADVAFHMEPKCVSVASRDAKKMPNKVGFAFHMEPNSRTAAGDVAPPPTPSHFYVFSSNPLHLEDAIVNLVLFGSRTCSFFLESIVAKPPSKLYHDQMPFWKPKDHNFRFPYFPF